MLFAMDQVDHRTIRGHTRRLRESLGDRYHMAVVDAACCVDSSAVMAPCENPISDDRGEAIACEIPGHRAQ